MSIKDFQADIEHALQKLKFHKKIGRVVRALTFGLITNKRKIGQYTTRYEECISDLQKYENLLSKADELDQSLESIVIEGVRIGKQTFSDISVVGKEDYGIDWDLLRQRVLSRDNYECQESDGYCSGPLQIHHIIPLSKGGSNDLSNLKTLCHYHHSLKHEHMRK